MLLLRELLASVGPARYERADVHILRNEGSVLAETIAVQLLPANTPSRRIDQPAPGNCPF